MKVKVRVMDGEIGTAGEDVPAGMAPSCDREIDFVLPQREIKTCIALVWTERLKIVEPQSHGLQVKRQGVGKVGKLRAILRGRVIDSVVLNLGHSADREREIMYNTKSGYFKHLMHQVD